MGLTKAMAYDILIGLENAARVNQTEAARVSGQVRESKQKLDRETKLAGFGVGLSFGGGTGSGMQANGHGFGFGGRMQGPAEATMTNDMYDREVRRVTREREANYNYNYNNHNYAGAQEEVSPTGAGREGWWNAPAQAPYADAIRGSHFR